MDKIIERVYEVEQFDQADRRYLRRLRITAGHITLTEQRPGSEEITEELDNMETARRRLNERL